MTEEKDNSNSNEIALRARFVPTIIPEFVDIERQWKDAATECLSPEHPECQQAVSKFKCNGIVTGHKVLDNNAAVEALIEKAPVHLKPKLTHKSILPHRRTQLLDAVLRRYWLMDKRGKIDGTIAPKALLRQQKQAARRADNQTSDDES